MSLEDIDALSEAIVENQTGHIEDTKKMIRGLKTVKTELDSRIKFSPGGVNEYMKGPGDNRAGVINWIHNSEGTGFLFHLTTTVNTAPTAGPIALGVDGNGIGLFVRNKLDGIGIRLQHFATGPLSCGFVINQQSAVSAGFQMEQYPEGTFPAIRVISYISTPGYYSQVWNAGNPGIGQAGGVQADSGILEWEQDIQLSGVKGLKMQGFKTTPVGDRSAGFLNHTGLRFSNASGLTNNWWVSSIKPNANNLEFQIGKLGAVTGESMEAVITLGSGETGYKKLGFYGKAPVERPTAVPVTIAGVHAALVALGLITA